MKVKVHLKSQSMAVEHADVRNAYTKDGLYCLLCGGTAPVVFKYPLTNIFRVIETDN